MDKSEKNNGTYGLKPEKYDFFVDLYAKDWGEGPQFKNWSNREGFTYEAGVRRLLSYIRGNRYLECNDRKRAAYILQDFKPENLNAALDCLENEEIAEFFRTHNPRDYYEECCAEKMRMNDEIAFLMERGWI